MISNTPDRVDSATDRLLEALDAVGETVLTRRRTLQIGAGVAAGSILASRLPFVRDIVGLGTAEATQAPSTVVLVYLDGGNDGLNTLVPLTDSRYQDFRGSLAIPANSTLPINSEYGLHSSLPFMHSMWTSGRVAFVRGVGYTNNNLSHFTSVDHWHSGYGAVGSPVVASPHSGWAGRYADTIGPSNPFTTVAIGPHTPVSLRGTSVAALQIPIPQSQLFGANLSDLNERWVADALRSINTTGSGTGTLGTALSARAVSAIDVAPTVTTAWTGAEGTIINRQMGMAANLINARLGVRVISVAFDGFDTHAQQALTHARLLGDLDTALSTFFSRLDPALSRSVAVMTYSEFGRRARSNNSAGTDHGSSSIGMVLGANVAGGIYGDEPGLATLDAAGNTLVTTDFRRLYSTMLAGWLGADPDPILGASHIPLPLFAAQPGVVPTTTSTTSTSTTRPPASPAGPSSAVPVTRAPAPDSPGVTTGDRNAPPAAGPGVTTTTVAGGSQAVLTPDGPSTSSTSTTSTVALVATTSAAPLSTTQATTSPTTLPATTPATSPATTPQAATPQPAPIQPVAPNNASGIIVPTELVVPGNGAVVAPSPTIPGSTILIPVGPEIVPSTTPSPPSTPTTRTAAPTTAAPSAASLTMVTQSSPATITVAVAHGPLRNDTWIGLFATSSLRKPQAVRYLNNKPRPGIVTRTSGSVSFAGLARGTYVVRVFANGSTVPAREARVVVR